ncbi:restriction endonuclease subunit M [Planctomycetales bacterium]|nr:restriction endonuclease subunit M [Planctomycetales bacterium]
MNYIGSKYSLLDFLESSIKQVVDDSCKVFCDLFAGTGAVGTHFKKLGYQIIANDLQYYSYVVNRHYIGNHNPLTFTGLAEVVPQNFLFNNPMVSVCNYLSNLEGIEGFLYKNYAPTGSLANGTQRQFFTDENAKKCDAIRAKIEQWKENGNINEDEYFFLLTSLIESIDARANTAAVYGAFLKKIKPSALKPLQIKPSPLIENDQEHQIFQEDINELVKTIKGDILYLDPPYNHRQYSSYYHILETIAKNDEPSIRGLAGIRNDDIKSLYCQKNGVKKAFQNVILNADVKYIFVSYNNEGIMPLDDIRDILSQRGQYHCFTKKYKRFQADVEANRNIKGNETVEYLHWVKTV